MALETVVFQQDPFSYGYKDFYNLWDLENLGLFGDNIITEDDNQKLNLESLDQISLDQQGQYGINWDSSTNSSPDGSFVGGGDRFPAAVANQIGRRKRRRTKSFKNKEEMENQRMTHIAVERNRRRQMNDYLAVLRSLMPPSYAQRGDQASIVGGAINFVKELEQLLQFLQSHKQKQSTHSKLFTNFFTYPQYSTSSPSQQHHRTTTALADVDCMAEKPSRLADIEVTMAETHANIKLLTRRRPKQLLTLVTGFHSLSLTILHLNITSTVDHMVLFSFSVKVEDDCQLNSVNDIATAVHELVGMIQEEESMPSC
ncbi:hypothetical protein M9H77_19656 [Catharanthus roseus]|uniref:Uncharacterized protein n=1 Tax=Catharanthus roseus TaxID=4058 RepID=A0ACC0BB76_CATRO|nr:hypothetical protein M9H77_19656 [Catharanthus roseus]